MSVSSVHNGPPLPIEASIGSCIRLILGVSGSNNWLLLLNHDDGNTKWQTQAWSASGIPNGLIDTIRDHCNLDSENYIQQVDFGPTGAWCMERGEQFGRDNRSGIRISNDSQGSSFAWGRCSTHANEKINELTMSIPTSILAEEEIRSSAVKIFFGSSENNGCENFVIVHNENGSLSSSNIADHMLSRINRIHERNKRVAIVRLFHNGGYFICDDAGTQWHGVGFHCEMELVKANVGRIEEVAIASDGSWIVIRPDHYESSAGVDTILEGLLQQFYRAQKARIDQRLQEIREYHEHVFQREGSTEINAAVRVTAEEIEEIRLTEILADIEAAESLEAEAEQSTKRERAIEREALQVASSTIERTKEEIVAAAADKAIKLERLLEDRLLDETRSIREQEKSVSEQEKSIRAQEKSVRKQKINLQNRKGSLEAFIEEIPHGICSNSVREEAATAAASNSLVDVGRTAECVVCYDNDAVRAVVPCGHHCLCDECSDRITSQKSPQCPLCRGYLQSTLKIFGFAANEYNKTNF